MTELDAMLQLNYRTIGVLNESHHVYLVQNIDTKKVFVRKELPLYCMDVLEYIENHPIKNIPQIFELAVQNETLMVIEEYISGYTMQEYIDLNGSFTEEQTVAYILELCAIVNELHHTEPKIIHRDIKPSNVMISADNVVKLLDLDAAKHYHSGTNRDTVTLGTAGYAAPEQYGVGASSVQTDIYSIGVLMNVMLCGDLPSVQMAEGMLSPIIRKCLAIHPTERYQSVEELMEAIHPAESTQDEDNDDKYTYRWQKYLPPGCRSLKPLSITLSLLGYAMMIWLGISFELSNSQSVADLWLNRIFLLVMLFGVAFFSGNYLNIHEQFPLTRSKNRIIKFLGILIYDMFIISLCPAFVGVVEGFFK